MASLVNLLGADSFEEDTLDVLANLGHGRANKMLTLAELDAVRLEIRRFTVRRTKRELNELVDREPNAYTPPCNGTCLSLPAAQRAGLSAQVSRSSDQEVAKEVRNLAASLTGVSRLETFIAVPTHLKNEYNDERWLQSRLVSTKGLAGHPVLAALRSSRAALVEHLLGTTAASGEFGSKPASNPRSPVT